MPDPRDDRPRRRREDPHVPAGARRLLPARLRDRRRAPLLHADRLRRAAGHRGRRGQDAAGGREPARLDRRPDRRAGGDPPALGPPLGLRPGARGVRPDRVRRGLGGVDGGPGQRARRPPAGAPPGPPAGAHRRRRRACGRPAATGRRGDLEAVLGFFGDLGADGRPSRIEAALDYVLGRGKPPRYRAPGEAIGLPGCAVRVYVLGPPRDEALLLRSDPSRRASEVYEQRLAAQPRRTPSSPPSSRRRPPRPPWTRTPAT